MFLCLDYKMNKFTNTILSNKIDFNTKDSDYRYVTAKYNIKKDDLLLIEHVYSSNDLSIMEYTVSKNKELYDNLYPRFEKWTKNTMFNKDNYAGEKVQKNSFKIDKKNFMIGLNVSWFNHSSNFNAIVTQIQCEIVEKVKLTLIYVIAHKNINKGEEIFIWYGNNYFSENNKINCKYNINYKLLSKIFYQYVSKKKCLNIYLNNVFAQYGLYILDEIVVTKRFLTFFKKTFPNLEITNYNIIKWSIEIKCMVDKNIKQYLLKYYINE